MSGWRNEGDIRKDLFEYSNMDYEENDTFTPAPPKSIAEYKARTAKVRKPGLFDDEYESDVSIFIIGRGKYPNRIITPGEPVELLPEDDIAIRKKIREVSGLGYGNEIIEREFCGSLDTHYKGEAEDSIIPDAKLHTVSECTGAASTSRLSSAFPKLNMRNMRDQSTEDSSETERAHSPILKKKSGINTEYSNPIEKMRWGNLEVKSQPHYRVETERQSTEDSSETESIKSKGKKSKKKKI